MSKNANVSFTKSEIDDIRNTLNQKDAQFLFGKNSTDEIDDQTIELFANSLSSGMSIDEFGEKYRKENNIMLFDMSNDEDKKLLSQIIMFSEMKHLSGEERKKARNVYMQAQPDIENATFCLNVKEIDLNSNIESILDFTAENNLLDYLNKLTIKKKNVRVLIEIIKLDEDGDEVDVWISNINIPERNNEEIKKIMTSNIEYELSRPFRIAYFENGKIVTDEMARPQDIIITFKSAEHSTQRLDIIKKLDFAHPGSNYGEPISILKNKENFDILMFVLDYYYFNSGRKGRKSKLSNEEKLRATIEYLTSTNDITYSDIANKYGLHESNMFDIVNRIVEWLTNPPVAGVPLVYTNYSLEIVIDMDLVKQGYENLIEKNV